MSLLPERPRSSFPQSRGGPSGRIFSDKHSRLRSQTLRTKPYHKLIQSTPPANSEARWSHDLFEDDSDLYGPRVRFHVKSPELITFGSIRPSPSLRPFGSTALSPPATAISAPPSSTKISSHPVVSYPAKPWSSHPSPAKPQSIPINSHSGLSLLSRIQCNDSQKLVLNDSASSLSHSNSNLVNPARLPENNSIHTSSTAPRSSVQQLHPAQSIKSPSQTYKNQHEFDAAMEKYLNGPVILEVANLADGTSAEDVKAAFADFGEIEECTTAEGVRQGNQPTLKAKMIFTNKADAEKAVEALNGALADGLTLAVKIIGRPTKKPERSDLTIPPTWNEIKTMKSATPATVTKLQTQDDVTMEDAEPPPTPTVPTGRLRSEVVAQCDPRASIQVEPRPIPVYRVEEPKPVIRNMLSRVQAFSGNHRPFPAIHHHAQHRNGFGTPSSQIQPVYHTQAMDSSKSLLARIKPN